MDSKLKFEKKAIIKSKALRIVGIFGICLIVSLINSPLFVFETPTNQDPDYPPNLYGIMSSFRQSGSFPLSDQTILKEIYPEIERKDGRKQSKVALIIAGSSRSFYGSWPTIYRTLVRNNDVDVFVIARVPHNPNSIDFYQFELVRTLPELRYIHLFTLKNEVILETLAEKFNLDELVKKAAGSVSVRENLIDTYLNWKGFQEFQKYAVDASNYDFIVRARPDLYLYETSYRANYFYLHEKLAEGGKITDIKKEHFIALPRKGISDKTFTPFFGIMSPKTASYYYDIINKYQYYCLEQGMEFDTGALLYHHLKLNGITEPLILDDQYAGIGPYTPLHFEIGGWQNIELKLCIRHPNKCDNMKSEFPNEESDIPPPES